MLISSKKRPNIECLESIGWIKYASENPKFWRGRTYRLGLYHSLLVSLIIYLAIEMGCPLSNSLSMAVIKQHFILGGRDLWQSTRSAYEGTFQRGGGALEGWTTFDIHIAYLLGKDLENYSLYIYMYIVCLLALRSRGDVAKSSIATRPIGPYIFVYSKTEERESIN